LSSTCVMRHWRWQLAELRAELRKLMSPEFADDDALWRWPPFAFGCSAAAVCGQSLTRTIITIVAGSWPWFDDDDDVYPRETPPQIRTARASPQRHTAAGTAAPTTVDTGNTVPQRANPTLGVGTGVETKLECTNFLAGY